MEPGSSLPHSQELIYPLVKNPETVNTGIVRVVIHWIGSYGVCKGEEPRNADRILIMVFLGGLLDRAK
jgi:hypothetical protein